MVIEENDSRFAIAPSTIPSAGKGLFAKEALAEGDQLEVIGALVRAESDADACSRYADRYKFRVGDKLLVPLGYGSIANHSDAPNAGKIIEGDKVYLRMLRAIARGEEIFFTYSPHAQAQFKK